MNTVTGAQGSAFWTDSLAEDLLKFLTGRVKCPDTAAELTQETYLRLHDSLRDSPPDNARFLAFRIAVNLAIDYQRRSAMRNKYTVNLELDISTHSVADSPAKEPMRILIAQERFDALQKALEELPADSRTAFLLNRVEGLNYQEIARRLNVSRSTVGRLLEHAIAHCTHRVGK